MGRGDRTARETSLLTGAGCGWPAHLSNCLARAWSYGPPKSRASLRTNALPGAIRPKIVEHLAEYVNGGPDAWVFTGERGNPFAAVTGTCSPGGRTRSLRSGGRSCTFTIFGGKHAAAQTYVSTKDLMARMGQDSPRAALVYQHASR